MTTREVVSGRFKVGEDWSATWTIRVNNVRMNWTDCTARLTCRYGDGETAPEAFTISTTPTDDGSIVLGPTSGDVTAALSRAKSATLRPGVLTGDLLVIDADGKSKYHRDVILQVDARSTLRP